MKHSSLKHLAPVRPRHWPSIATTTSPKRPPRIGRTSADSAGPPCITSWAREARQLRYDPKHLNRIYNTAKILLCYINKTNIYANLLTYGLHDHDSLQL